MNKILFIGCGHMGSALLTSWYKNTNNYFTVVDPDQYKKIGKKFKKRCQSYKDIESISDIKKFDIILFAIKPQIAHIVLKNFINLKFKKNILFITIVAGKKISFYNKFLPDKNHIIRAMPNMPAIIEEGMTCLVHGKFISKKDKIKANSLFKWTGKYLWLKNENDLEKVTSISGSGPGYFFLFINCLEKAAKKIGFKNDIARKLAYQTAIGSSLLLKTDSNSLELEKKIAISGGTTEAALKTFKKKKALEKIVYNSVKSAYNRALILGKK